jgi:hypothetical protein
METREGELGLGQRARRGDHRHALVFGSIPCSGEQGRLADPGFAANDRRAAAPANRVDQPVQLSQLVDSPDKLDDSRISAGAGNVHLASSAATLPV